MSLKLFSLIGSPQQKLSVNDITEIACHEAEIYHKAKVVSRLYIQTLKSQLSKSIFRKRNVVI